MREIKFRGRSKCGRWWVGDLLTDPTWNPMIRYYNGRVFKYEIVEPETVGQYTGLKDSDGKEIYEGDIIEAIVKDERLVREFGFKERQIGKITANLFHWLFGGSVYLDRIERYYEMRVIGNVYDNSELLNNG